MEQLQPACHWNRVCDGRCVTTRIVPRVRVCSQAYDPPVSAGWCSCVLLLVLCAIVGTQHSNRCSGMLAVGRAWPVRTVVTACVSKSTRGVAWRPGQPACAGRVRWFDTPLCFGGKTFCIPPFLNCFRLCRMRLTKSVQAGGDRLRGWWFHLQRIE